MPATQIDRPLLVEQARELCRARGASLLFLTLFGSTLYGTESPGTSDLDLRGVFLPSSASLILNKAPKSLHASSGDALRRNTAGDLDIDLWSIQHWLLTLLPAGDTGALDLLFAPSHAACTLCRHPALDAVFARPLKLLDIASGRSYAEYSLRQAKKYGIRGSRVGALKAVRARLEELRPEPRERLEIYLDRLAEQCADGRFCAVEQTRDKRALRLCGRLHTASIRMGEFQHRLEEELRATGARAEAAERGEGVDFKALSHALRALDQMEELLLAGTITFPLKTRAELVAVKRGAYSWNELEPRILERIAAVDALREQSPYAGSYDPAFAEECVLACYEQGESRTFSRAPA